MNIMTARRLFVTLATATALSLPAPCQAATAALPWDCTLMALQDMLTGYIAPAAIGLALSGSIVLYALGGRDEQAGRLFGSALGGCIALAIVYFLNYVAF
jgi:type IV secretory pathway VirB2 component (pilin)